LRGGGAHFSTNGQSASVPLRTRPRAEPLVVAGSRSHADPRMLTALEKLGPHELYALGSSLKFCRTARGEADVYLRLGLTSEWDTAAAQCVLDEAGGAVLDLEGQPFRYNRGESLLNPEFIAVGDGGIDWPARLQAP
jgi:3'(2'), 5'-bisphosphate nucleotidase